MSLDWTHIISGLVGAFVVFLLGIAKDTWMRRQQQIRAARHLAIRVVCVLDDFVETCMQVVADDGLCEGQRTVDGFLEAQVGNIISVDYPSNVEWTSIDHTLMYRLLSLPSRLKAANGVIDSTWVYTGPPDFEEFFEERCLKYSELGLIALNFTQEMRKRYGLPENVTSYWDPETRLKEASQKVETERKRRDERRDSQNTTPVDLHAQLSRNP